VTIIQATVYAINFYSTGQLFSTLIAADKETALYLLNTAGYTEKEYESEIGHWSRYVKPVDRTQTVAITEHILLKKK
jgi:hypothetical protein